MSEVCQGCSSHLPQGTVKLLLQGPCSAWCYHLGIYRHVPVVVPPFTHLHLAEFFFQQGEVPLAEQSWTGAGIRVVTALWGACFLMLRDGVTWCSKSIQLCLRAGNFVLFSKTL